MTEAQFDLIKNLKAMGEAGAFYPIEAYDCLQAILSGPLGTALADPAMRKALEVVAERWPRVLEEQRKSAPGPWVVRDVKWVHSECPCCGDIAECMTFGPSEYDPSCHHTAFIVEACNMAHYAAHAYRTQHD